MAVTFLHKVTNVLTATKRLGTQLQPAGEICPIKRRSISASTTRNNIVQASFQLERGPLQCVGTVGILAACRSLLPPANHLAPPFFFAEHSASAQVEQKDMILLSTFLGTAMLNVYC